MNARSPSVSISSRIVLLAASAAGLAAQAPIQFTDTTLAAGITWRHVDIAEQVASTMGAGGAFLDYDGDGRLDVFLVGSVSTPGLFRNLGDGSFADVTVTAGLDRAPLAGEWYMSATVGDIDNDGDPDIYLGLFGENRMFENNGDGTFSDITDPVLAGLAWTTGAAFGDYDGDGLLDLYVGNYVANPALCCLSPFPNRLLHNEGDGVFTDVTAATGTAGAGTTLAVTWTDFDDDGDVDLMVGNDFGSAVEPNRLYRNDGPGATPGAWLLTEVSAAIGADIGTFCMGIAPGDIDRDLDLDDYYTSIGRNFLLRYDGAAGYVDITTQTGTENTFDPTTSSPQLKAIGWGCGFFDFDQDGWLDLYVVNGALPDASGTARPPSTPNALFHHDGALMTFTDISAAAGAGDRGVGRGAAFGDYDQDGDVDVLAINVNGRPALLRNDSPNQGHWLRVHPTGVRSPRDGEGARVQVDLGGFSLVREARRNFSYESSSETTLHFGLGSEDVVRRVWARWPSGVEHESWFEFSPDTTLLLVEPTVTVADSSVVPASVREGERLELILDLQNHAPQAQNVQHLIAIRANGQIVAFTPALPAVVPASGTLQLPLRFDVPAGFTGGTPLPLEFLWTVLDAGGSFDQLRGEVLFTP
ncbi:MAG: CRTAC1 family protein [Planctomycetota bacterium]